MPNSKMRLAEEARKSFAVVIMRRTPWLVKGLLAGLGGEFTRKLEAGRSGATDCVVLAMKNPARGRGFCRVVGVWDQKL